MVDRIRLKCQSTKLLKEMTITLPVPTQISLNGHPIGVEPKTNNRGQSVYSLKDIYIGNYVCDLEDTHLYALPKGSLIEDYDRDVEFKDINRDASNVSDPFLNLLPELKAEVDNQLSALYEVAVPHAEAEEDIEAEGVDKDLLNYARREIKNSMSNLQSNPQFVDIKARGYGYVESTGENSFKIQFTVDHTLDYSRVTQSFDYYGTAFFELVDGELVLTDLSSR